MADPDACPAGHRQSDIRCTRRRTGAMRAPAAAARTRWCLRSARSGWLPCRGARVSVSVAVWRQLAPGARTGAAHADDRRVAQVGVEAIAPAQLVVERLEHREVELLVAPTGRTDEVLVGRFIGALILRAIAVE